jgi:hypothetical protein
MSGDTNLNDILRYVDDAIFLVLKNYRLFVGARIIGLQKLVI